MGASDPGQATTGTGPPTPHGTENTRGAGIAPRLQAGRLGHSGMPTVTQPVQGSPVSVLPLPTTGRFVLCQVGRAEERDAGRYTCEALNQAGRSEKHYNLNVWGEGPLGWFGVPPPPLPARHPPHTPFSYSVPPVFPTREPRTLTVMEGHPARLSCECRGVPFPKISWKKDGKAVGWEEAGV